MLIMKRGRLRVVKARGFRVGFGYLPHWRTNPDTERPRELIVWCGPYFATWSLRKKGWAPRDIADPDRIEGLLQGRRDLNRQIHAAFRAKHHRQENYRLVDVDFERIHGVHMDIRRQWQAESDAVRLREMEDAERDDQDPSH
jgi:hypothetical protein